ARPARRSRHSFCSRRKKTRCRVFASGEGKKNLLKPLVTDAGTGLQLFEIAFSAHRAAGAEHEPVTDAFRIRALAERQQQRARAWRRTTERADRLAGLLEVEAIEGLVHDKKRLRGEEPEGQQQSAPVSLGERAGARRKHRPKG